MSLTLETGALIGGKYRLERLIGRGGMGEVWAAEQALTKKHVALKFLVGDAANNPDTRRRFMREARAACAVSHPNVVQIHDVVEVDGDTPVLIMELLKGESLEAKLQREGRLGVEETIAILQRVVSAVGTAHTQGVVHRDLKPDNIFLSQTPDGVEVKVLDFGIAKVGPSEDGSQTGALTGTGTMLGTPYYMSPEQAFGEKKIDHRADIWSLGIVMFRCLSGELPTRADNLGQILKIIMTRSIPKLSAVAPHVPKELAQLVDKMLSYAPTDRPADLREVRSTLERIAGGSVEDFGPPAVDASSLGGVAILPEAAALQHASRNERRKVSSGVVALAAAGVLVAITAGGVLMKKSSNAAGTASAPVAAATTGDSTSAAPTATATATATVTTTSLPGATAPTNPDSSPAPDAPSAISASGSGAVSSAPSTKPGPLRPGGPIAKSASAPVKSAGPAVTGPTPPTIVTEPKF